MGLVDTAELVWVERRAVRRDGNEKGVVWIKHLPCEDLEPLARHASSVDTFFAMEADVELAKLHLVARLEVESLERVAEDLFTTNGQLQRWV